LPQTRPEVLASRSELEAEAQLPPARPKPAKVNPLLYVALLLLMAGGILMQLSKDVKTMDNTPIPGPVEFVQDEIVVDLNDNITDAVSIAALAWMLLY
jgi:hypothetical protein